MNLIKKVLPTFFTIAFGFMLSVSAQPKIEVNFQGLLTNSEGKVISGEPFNLVVKLLTAETSVSELWKFDTATASNEEGWVSFVIPDISGYLIKGEELQGSLVISLEFLPASGSSWIGEGENFFLSYTLTPTLREDGIHLRMSRLEGSELTVHQENNLFAFKDEYPFMYLTGGFLLTDNPPLDQQSVDDLHQWITPDPEEGSATRGVKGGFPQGTYRKKDQP